ncbi:hypothetical protein GMORB2_2424 [Geosmithia morbida]|uniref:sterol 3beta-glucosyltransferase n=1 Tax=Geosmithia morbida TaxID=1094350 RepID=A0A9P4YPW1_9HYPO|nr:uncharacterized protein GMORB2_2424 [Geosmithia morbida]KAF4120938.1 hypothetical protein GMORB2_2424 [Geosmithia morbida]
MPPPPGDGGFPVRRSRASVADEQQEQYNDSLPFPEGLRDSDSSDDDGPGDDAPSQGPPLYMNMNQSIFGLIAAAGAKVDFTHRFEESSSDDDDDADDIKGTGTEDLSQTTILQPPGRGLDKNKTSIKRSYKLLRSLPSLPKIKSKPRGVKLPTPPTLAPQVSNALGPPATIKEEDEDRPPPVMSRMLEARAQMSSRPSFDLDSREAAGSSPQDGPTQLAERLKDIFDFEEPEQVVQEYPCWLLQSVLLQGFLYITAKHICFYAYLPKKTTESTKTGFLSKTGKRNPKYNRYWFRLKGDVLSYYHDATNPYFPHGQIDLTYGISVNITDKEKEGTHFDIVTRHRTYAFRAESAPSAKEWVKSLQRVIFRSHNEGDTVKISLPISNVVDVEEAHMVEFAHTCKIRVVDSDETFAIDEYFFSFFSHGVEAIDILKLSVEGNGSNIPAGDGGDGSGSANGKWDRPPAEEPFSGANRARRTSSVSGRAKTSFDPTSPTLSSPGPAVSSTRDSRRSSDASQLGGVPNDMTRSRFLTGAFSPGSPRSSSAHQTDDERFPSHQNGEESESFVLQSSIEDPSFSNIASSAADDPSASQLLNDSQVFQQTSPVRAHHALSPDDPIGPARNSRTPTPGLATYSGRPCSSGGQTGEQSSGANLDPQEQQQHQQLHLQTLQNIGRMGSYPLERAGALAGYLNKTQQHMRSLITSESMGYVEKVSGMWKGARKHYDDPDGLNPDDDLGRDPEGTLQVSRDRFRAHFSLPEGEKLQATYFGYIFRVLPLYGKVYISDRSFCFRSLLPGTRTKLILPLQDIETVHKEKGFRLGYSGLVVVIKGHEELFFEFGQAGDRDDCTVTLLRSLEATRYLKEAKEVNRKLQGQPADGEDTASTVDEEHDPHRQAAQSQSELLESSIPDMHGTGRRATGLSAVPTILDPDTSLLNFKPKKSMRITCLTIGSRGDVQPYIALCKGLRAEGHKPRIATHAEFQGWIESHGIEFARVEGDPADLMCLCIEHGTFTWAFLREANSSFRGWLDGLLLSAVEACEGSDMLIESPSAMAGIHIAEKMGIPYFRAFTMPWTRTRAYPHAFIMPEHKMGGAYNYMTYIMFDNIFWKAIAHQVNRWRNQTLGLPSTGMEKMQPNKVPFLYNFSPSVVTPPLDFSDWIRVTGYWFLDEGDKYEPPQALLDFIKKARDDGKKLVYVGFGSIIVDDPAKMTREVIDAVLKADVRCILSKGWSERISVAAAEAEVKGEAGEAGDGNRNCAREPEPEMPPEIHVIKSAPHDWLFSRIDAAAHHGGSGTTGASLRAGIPTIIRPFFGDQYFFANRVEDLGVGVHLRKWGTTAFGRALWEATRNHRMIVKARVLGEEIRKENGVDMAIQCIYRDLEYAKRLIMLKAGKNADPARQEDDGDENEESWTFVGSDEPNPDLVTPKLSEALLAQAQVNTTATATTATTPTTAATATTNAVPVSRQEA